MYFSIRKIRYSVAAAACLAFAATVSGNPPLWWSEGDPPVIDPAAEENNQGPANIGQAKWMAKSALDALSAVDPDTATSIEAALVGPGLPIPSWDLPADQAARDKNHAPLLIGQLKAIAQPFYDHLNTLDNQWVREQIELNLDPDPTLDPNPILGQDFWQVTGDPNYTEGGYYPWNPATPVDQNKALATIGQLKAVFSLRFESLVNVELDPSGDADGDGITNEQEVAQGTNPRLADSDTDGIDDAEEGRRGTNPNSDNTDGDDLMDIDDADPRDKAINWKSTPEPRYAFLEIKNWNADSHGQPIMSNKKGHVLCEKAVWKDETWTQIKGVGASTIGPIPPVVISNKFKWRPEDPEEAIELYAAQVTSIDDEGRIAGYAEGRTDRSYNGILPLRWINADDAAPLALEVPSTITESPDNYDYDDRAFIDRNGTLTLIPYEISDTQSPFKVMRRLSSPPTSSLDSLRCSFSGMGSFSRDGTCVGRTPSVDGAPGQPWAWISSGEHAIVGAENTLNPDYYPNISPGPISFTGPINCIGSTPATGAIATAQERPVISLDGSVLIHNGTKWLKSKSLQGVTAISRSGTALTNDGTGPAVWRNAKITKIKELCPELEAEGIISFETKDVNDQGVILIKDLSGGKLGLLLPVEVTLHRRGTINAPGAAIPRPTDSDEVYEAVTLENADYDETNWRPSSMADAARANNQDGVTEEINRLNDDDFVKLHLESPIPRMQGSIELVMENPGQGNRLRADDLRFYNSEGERIQLADLRIADLQNPQGPLEPMLQDDGMDLFVEIADLGQLTREAGQATGSQRRYADLILRLTLAGEVVEQRARIYRGGYWRNQRNGNAGTIAFYDGKGRYQDQDGAWQVDVGNLVHGPYNIRAGNGTTDETVPNRGPTPVGWYGLFERLDIGQNWQRRRDGGWSRPQQDHNYNHPGGGQQRPPLQDATGQYWQQGSYSQWSAGGDRTRYTHRGATTLPSVQFKFELVNWGHDAHGRTWLQIHPDGFNDGTSGCVGLQTYNDCCRLFFLLRHYFGTRLRVETP